MKTESPKHETKLKLRPARRIAFVSELRVVEGLQKISSFFSKDYGSKSNTKIIKPIL
jgi:hypothetical protein